MIETTDKRTEPVMWNGCCEHCGRYIKYDPHSWCLGPQAGHYCWGCEPPGHEAMMVCEP